jgi:hypothetical protein
MSNAEGTTKFGGNPLIFSMTPAGVSGVTWTEEISGLTWGDGATTLTTDANGFTTPPAAGAIQTGSLPSIPTGSKLVILLHFTFSGNQNSILLGDTVGGHGQIRLKRNTTSVFSEGLSSKGYEFVNSALNTNTRNSFVIYADLSDVSASFRRCWNLETGALDVATDTAATEGTAGDMTDGFALNDVMTIHSSITMHTLKMYNFSSTPSDLNSGVNELLLNASYAPWE